MTGLHLAQEALPAKEVSSMLKLGDRKTTTFPEQVVSSGKAFHHWPFLDMPMVHSSSWSVHMQCVTADTACQELFVTSCCLKMLQCVSADWAPPGSL